MARQMGQSGSKRDRTWRKRAHVVGTGPAVSPAALDSALTLEVEIWDEIGGVFLQFLGRREIA